jgi:hypothetical protein
MDTAVQEQEALGKPRRGRLTFYHPNAKGTGTALQLDLRMNRNGEDRYDCFFLEMARQKTAGRDENGRSAATFDWPAKVTVKLDFLDVCELLMVLEGKADHAGGQREGLYHENGKANTIISLRKNPEQGGYGLGLSRKGKQDGQLFKAQILLSDAEAIGLRSVFQSALFHLAFRRSLAEAAAPDIE